MRKLLQSTRGSGVKQQEHGLLGDRQPLTRRKNPGRFSESTILQVTQEPRFKERLSPPLRTNRPRPRARLHHADNDYLDEKVDALERWGRHVEAIDPATTADVEASSIQTFYAQMIDVAPEVRNVGSIFRAAPFAAGPWRRRRRGAIGR